MKLLLENWREYLKEDVQDRRTQMLKIAAVMWLFKRDQSQAVFDKVYTVAIVSNNFMIDKLPFLGFSDEEVSQLEQDLWAIRRTANNERWTSYEGPGQRLKELTTQYNLPPKVEISPEDARAFVDLIKKAPLHSDKPLYRGLEFDDVPENDFAEAVLEAGRGSKSTLTELIRKNIRPLSKEEDRFSSFTADFEEASTLFAGGSRRIPIIDPDGHEHWLRPRGMVLVLENPKFGFVLQEGWGEQEVLVPYWSFIEPLEQNIKVKSKFYPKGTEIRYEKSKQDLTTYSVVMAGVTQ